MKTIFGVSSATPVSKKLKNGYTICNLVEDVYAKDEEVLEKLW